MKRTDVIVIGGGQAGLAMSYCLTQSGVDHRVLERGRVGERWHSERWDSLRLLSPNWQSRLPGFQYQGPDPEGFMSARALAHRLQGYARLFGAPLECHTSVRSVRRLGAGFRVETDRGDYLTRCVVIATGACDKPRLPSAAAGL